VFFNPVFSFVCYNTPMDTDDETVFESHPHPWYVRYYHTLRHHWQTVAFLLGFLTDILWLNQVDSVMDNATILLYVFLSTISLFLLYAGITQRFGERWSPRVQGGAAIVMQYAFGGLFSGMLILYGRAGDPLASWPFLILFAAGMIANEVLQKREEKLLFNLVSYYIGLFSYMVLGTTILTGYMGPLVFIGCGVAALVYMYGLIRLLALVIPRYLLMQMRHIVFSLLLTFVFLNVLYFTNIIPPIPLSLNEILIVQGVVHYQNPSRYELTYEPVSWWRLDRQLFPVVHPGPNHAIACFTSVYAPVLIKTDIVHIWEYKDSNGDWKEQFRLSYPISGEARNGYRGYTETSAFKDGTWRCTVATTRGQIIGRQRFTVDTTVDPVNLAKRVE
jgi:Protein of unknown function (DUF2914)